MIATFPGIYLFLCFPSHFFSRVGITHIILKYYLKVHPMLLSVSEKHILVKCKCERKELCDTSIRQRLYNYNKLLLP